MVNRFHQNIVKVTSGLNPDIKNTNDVFESDIEIINRFQTDANDYK